MNSVFYEQFDKTLDEDTYAKVQTHMQYVQAVALVAVLEADNQVNGK